MIDQGVNQEKNKDTNYKNLREMRDKLRRQAEQAIKQIKENNMLSLQQIREGELLFDNIQQTNKYLKKKNQQKKKKQEQKSQSQQKQQRKQNQSQQQDKNEKNKKISSNKRNNILPVNYDQGRKWNQVLQNQKKGKFQPQEKRILTSSLSQYLLINNIQLDTLIESIKHKDQESRPKISQNLKLWTHVCSVLPNRSLRSCYKFLIRKLTKGEQNKKWTEDQQQELLALHEKFGNKWKQIGQKLGKNPQSVRDKFRNLQVKQKISFQRYWRIQQLIFFFQSIQNQSQTKYLKQGYKIILKNAEFHNQKQKQYEKKYNCKYMLSPHYVQLLDFINSDQFCKVDRSKIKWKQISEKLGNKNQMDCKNKYIQFIEVLNRDYSGESQIKILNFIQDQIKQKGELMNQNEIQWEKWNKQEDFTRQEAESKWNRIKKGIKQRSEKTFYQLFKQAKRKNLRKITKNYLKQQKQSNRQQQRQKKRNKSILKTKSRSKQQRINNNTRSTNKILNQDKNKQVIINVDEIEDQALEKQNNIQIQENIQVDLDSSLIDLQKDESIMEEKQIKPPKKQKRIRRITKRHGEKKITNNFSFMNNK